MKKNLIIYYSRKGQNYVNGSIQNLSKGNTEICAELIQKAVGGDLFEIETINEYSTDYMKCTEEAKKELQWWGTYPCGVFTQLERLQWGGKKVMALMTHEGSGLGHCEKDLKAICKGATFGSGLAVHGADAAQSEQTVARWAKANV